VDFDIGLSAVLNGGLVENSVHDLLCLAVLSGLERREDVPSRTRSSVRAGFSKKILLA
jgi:hypothetical protein